MPLIRLNPDRLHAESRRAEENAAVERAWRRTHRRYALAAGACLVGGLVVAGSSLAVNLAFNAEEIGAIAMLAGVTLGDVGVLAVLMVYLVRERGES